MADIKGPAGNNAQWLPRQGTLKWQLVPGHAPGQVLTPLSPLALYNSRQPLTILWDRAVLLSSECPMIGLALGVHGESCTRQHYRYRCSDACRQQGIYWVQIITYTTLSRECYCKPAMPCLAGG